MRVLIFELEDEKIQKMISYVDDEEQEVVLEEDPREAVRQGCA